MNRYESYKPSNIDWVGEIPSHWETIQPKYKLNRVTRPIDDEDEVITCFRDGVVTLRKNRREDGFTNSIKEHGYQQIHPGDLVVHEMDGFAGAIGISDSKGKSTPVYTVIEPDHRTDVRYISYLLREMSQTGKIESLARSIRERTTDFRWNMWSVVHFPFPNVEEQKLISRYLDKKTSQIDSLVEKIQKKIELLKEQRTSVINHFVTKGLDPNVEMKDSGSEWIGETPKHWDMTKLKYLCPEGVQYGLNIESDSYKEIGVRFLRITDINSDGTLKSSGGVFLPEENVPREYLLNKNDILFSRSGGTVGKSTRISSTDHRMSFAGYLVRFSFQNEEISRFVKWVSESGIYWSWIDLQIIQSTIQNVNGEKYANFSFPVPSHSEISNINDFLDEKTLKVDETINKHGRKINLLSEYRQSIISSVVTGKVRVTEDMV